MTLLLKKIINLNNKSIPENKKRKKLLLPMIRKSNNLPNKTLFSLIKYQLYLHLKTIKKSNNPLLIKNHQTL